MGTFQFKLHDIGEGIAEAEIVAWHVKVGDKVKEDQPLVDMMTDKATVELSSPAEGVVQRIDGKVGERVAVGSVLVTLATEGSAQLPVEKPMLAPATAAPVPTPKKTSPRASPEPVQVAPVSVADPLGHATPGARPAASPA